MNDEKQEKIADIVREMRVYAKKSKINGGEIDVWNWLAHFADRIEAAWTREREAGAEAAQICGEIGEMIGREATGRQPVKVPEIDIEYEFDPSQIKKCELCGSDAAVYENTHYTVYCSNLNCDRSILSEYTPCWRTNIVKAILDWNEPGWDKLEGNAK